MKSWRISPFPDTEPTTALRTPKNGMAREIRAKKHCKTVNLKDVLHPSISNINKKSKYQKYESVLLCLFTNQDLTLMLRVCLTC